MTDMLVTPRCALPLLATAQAQKEVTHNEALVLLDALIHAAVVAGPVAESCMRFGPSPSIFNATCLMLSTMSVTSSRTPASDENS